MGVAACIQPLLRLPDLRASSALDNLYTQLRLEAIRAGARLL
jgi:hypothetical protein